MTTIELTAPSHWAAYLINGDAAGLNPDEVAAIDKWLNAEGVEYVADCRDAGFCWSHDAGRIALAADCQVYTCFAAEA